MNRQESPIAKAFVTGGSGFVGRNLIEALRARGCDVQALARSEASARAVRSLGAVSTLGDLSSVDAMVEGMRGADVVVHAAAMVEDWGPYDEFFTVNVTGTDNVIEAARRAGVSRLVHVSTEAVLLGGRPLVGADEHWPVPDNQPGNYPRTKAMAEKRVLAANSTELSVRVVRPRLIWGAGDTSLLPQLAALVSAGRFSWIGGGEYLTSTCHVRNVCEGILLAAERGTSSGVYFLTDGPDVQFKEFLSQLLGTQGVRLGSRSIPRPLAQAGAAVLETVWRALRLGGAPPLTRTIVQLSGQTVTVNDARARAELGYQEVVTRAEGLAEMASVSAGPARVNVPLYKRSSASAQ